MLIKCYDRKSEYLQKQTSQWLGEITCKPYHIPYSCGLHFVECEKPAKRKMAEREEWPKRRKLKILVASLMKVL